MGTVEQIIDVVRTEFCFRNEFRSSRLLPEVVPEGRVWRARKYLKIGPLWKKWVVCADPVRPRRSCPSIHGHALAPEPELQNQRIHRNLVLAAVSIFVCEPPVGFSPDAARALLGGIPTDLRPWGGGSRSCSPSRLSSRSLWTAPRRCNTAVDVGGSIAWPCGSATVAAAMRPVNEPGGGRHG